MEGQAARSSAKIAGWLWLVVIVTGIFAEMFVRATLFVRNDGGATAANIVQHQGLFRLGVVADITATASYLAVVSILYGLLKPAGRTLSTVAAAFGVAGSAVSALNMLAFFAPLVIITNVEHFTGFTPQQLQSLVLLQVKLYGLGANISLILFSGVYLVLVGVLVIRSQFIPVVLGVLLTIAGGCYLIGSVSSFAAPALARVFGTFIYLPGGVAEGAMTLWLIARGVDARAWEARVAGNRSLARP